MTSGFSNQRRKMVDGQLRTIDVNDTVLLDAMADVPREEFLPARLRELAYIDEDLEIGDGRGGAGARYLMEPSSFARLVQLAAIRPGDFILHVGCGTGYGAAVLSRAGGSVVALEEDPGLAAAAQGTLARLGFDTVAVVEGPLAEGWPSQAPFDVILIEGAVDAVPQPLFDQLRDGGRLVAVTGTGNAGRAMLYGKTGDRVASRPAFNAAVRELAAFRAPPSFRF